MRVKIEEPISGKIHLNDLPNPEGKSLGELFGNHAGGIRTCLINGRFVDDWRSFISTDSKDSIKIFPKTSDIPGILVGLLINLALSALLKAIMPKPKRPRGNKPEESFGVAGFTNVTTAGSAKFVVYGEERVFGSVIGSRVETTDDGKAMKFSVLYFMGDTGIDGYESIDQVKINDSDVENYPDVTVETRLGTAGQAIVKGFDSSSQVFSDGRPLPLDTPIVVTTKNNNVNRATVITQAVQYSPNSRGTLRPGVNDYKIEIKKSSEPVGSYAEIAGSPFRVQKRAIAPLYSAFVIDFASPDEWNIRITQTHDHAESNTQGGDPVLFNIQEEAFTTRTYDGSALLALHGVSSQKIQSLENLRVSAIVKGKKVLVWNGASDVLQWTRKRMWILRDVVTHAKVGLGHRVPDSLFDKDAALIEQNYLDESVTGFDGSEARDLCDFILSDRVRGWDFVRESLLGDVGGALILSGGKLKPVLFRPRSPNLLYSYPGNILEEDGIKTVIGRTAGEINTVRGVFRDPNLNYKPNPIEVQDSAIGSDPVRAESFQLDTIKRESQAIRELTKRLKEAVLVRRHFRYKSPATAQVSEPFDVDRLSYKTVDQKRGWSGFCPAGSSTTELQLDRDVDLEP